MVLPANPQEERVGEASDSSSMSGHETEGGNLVRRLLARRASGDAKKELRRAVPAEVQRRLTQVGKRFFFPDGEEAFLDRGRRLTTHSENSALVRLLIETARLRQWRRVEVSGSRQFRQRVWELGMKAGLEVEGYRPTRFERAKLAQHGDERRDGTPREPARENAPTAFQGANSTSGVSVPRRAGEDELIVGRLVAHGPENYQFRNEGALSYYVKLQTDRGARVLWGKDLPRALSGSLTKVAIGDVVGIRRVGREAVTVIDQTRDREGKVVAQREQQAHRNQWLVEKVSFFTERARLARQTRDRVLEARETARSNPELGDTSATLRAAADFAAQRIRHPEDRDRFMALLRERLVANDLGTENRRPRARNERSR